MTIPDILNGTASYSVQNEDEVTFGFNVRREEEKINFEKSAIEIKNLVRGLNSIPGAYTFLDGKRLKIYKVEIINKQFLSSQYGEIVLVDHDGFVVAL